MHQMRQEQIFPENLYTVQEKNVLQNSWSPVPLYWRPTISESLLEQFVSKTNITEKGMESFWPEKPIQLVSVSVLSDHSCFNESTLKEKKS